MGSARHVEVRLEGCVRGRAIGGGGGEALLSHATPIAVDQPLTSGQMPMEGARDAHALLGDSFPTFALLVMSTISHSKRKSRPRWSSQ